jgi:hypothetical protein
MTDLQSSTSKIVGNTPLIRASNSESDPFALKKEEEELAGASSDCVNYFIDLTHS